MMNMIERNNTMHIYLVGGAVRDRLLNRPVTERDYVVVGATPKQMLDLGFQQVGKDFPVFLHPKTKEEYALARTERKSGRGYKGFDCNASQDVTLAEDLKRRDLTINALAEDEQGQIVDPYGGLDDLKNRCLRHVSDAFIEDPLRVLRIARFAARYHYLGFTIAKETMCLMRSMVRNGELGDLVPERVWQEWRKSLDEKNPEVFYQVLRQCGALRVLIPEVDRLYGIPNPTQWHPEVDTGVHTMMVLQQSAKLTNNTSIRFAALLHDLGKVKSPQATWPRHHGHDNAGVAIIQALCRRCKVPNPYQELAVLVAKYHILVHKSFELNASSLVKLLVNIDAFRRPQRFIDILTACRADARGRLGQEHDPYHQADFLAQLFEQLKQISIQDLIQQQARGDVIRSKLHQRRVAAAKDFRERYRLP